MGSLVMVCMPTLQQILSKYECFLISGYWAIISLNIDFVLSNSAYSRGIPLLWLHCLSRYPLRVSVSENV